MTIGRHPSGRRAAPRGVWLAILAIAGQVLLPFLLAFEIAVAAPQGDGEIGLPLCSITQHAAVPKPRNDRTGHHSPAGGCPICQALATTQLFTQPPPVALAIPRISTTIVRPSAPSLRPTVAATAPYQSRAPPSNV